ncbi:MAG: ABC transporter permease [Actinobacteria bacterium]|jgi:ABC-2 type transport system permease protein|nr:ABC transporter permease [Actinomycetota bacterium]
MKSFKAYFKKEILESVRTNKYLILFIGIVFWALLDPLMLKLLPLLMKNYLPPDIAVMFSTFTRDTAFQTFLNDLFQIGTLFIAFTLMGLLSNEVSLKKLVFPYSRGANPAGVVLAKYIHYTVTISLFILIAFLTNYFYINRLFTGGILSIEIVLKSSLLYMLYYSVLLSILLYLSSLLKRGIIAGITVLVLGYTLSIFNQFKVVRAYLPNYLLLKAADIGYIFDNSLISTVIISFCIIILLVFFSILRMKKIDVA